MTHDDDKTMDTANNGGAKQSTDAAAGTSDEAIRKAYAADKLPEEPLSEQQDDREFAGNKPGGGADPMIATGEEDSSEETEGRVNDKPADDTEDEKSRNESITI